MGSVTEQHGSVRSCKSGFDSRPAHQFIDGFQSTQGEMGDARSFLKSQAENQIPTLFNFHCEEITALGGVCTFH